MAMKSSSLSLLVASVLFLALPAWTGRIRPDAYEGGRSRDEAARQERNTSSLAFLLGQFRTSASDVLFLKTENYLHSGVEYVPHHIDDRKPKSLQEEQSGIAEHQSEVPSVFRDERGNEIIEEEPMHAGVETVIRSPENDFRGWIGSLHRHVKPWRDPSLAHIHTTGTELLPWFRVITLQDPSYVRAYATGVYWLMQKDSAAAIEYAREAVRNNPNSFQSHLTLGEAYMHAARQLPEDADAASTHAAFDKVRAAYSAAYECVLKERPANLHELPETHPWNLWMDTDAMRAVQMAALMEKSYGNPQRAAEIARRGLEIYPANETLLRIVRP